MIKLTKKEIEEIFQKATKVDQDMIDLLFKKDVDSFGKPYKFMFKLKGVLSLSRMEGYITGVTSEF